MTKKKIKRVAKKETRQNVLEENKSTTLRSGLGD